MQTPRNYVDTVRLFISSPGDVGHERQVAAIVIDRLQGEFAARLKLDPFFWEDRPMRATGHFQDEQNIIRPSSTDNYPRKPWYWPCN